tara:strand:+ start:2888 stop:3682 length:795 start_codon:yes stop_codon:yes gene_type:complete
MPTILDTVGGYLRQSVTVFSGTGAWFNGQPLIDTTAGIAYNDLSRNTSAIYCTFGHVGSATVTDIRFPFMSFDVSSISSAPASGELKIWGYSNSGTGNPTSHSSNGIQGWGPTYGGAMASTTSVATSDWGKLASLVDADDYMPPKYTNTLTSWNVGTSTPNTFTLTSAALTAIGANDNFQIAIGHKFWWDSGYDNPPFASGNSPNGDDDFLAIAGLYFGRGDGTYSDYKPQLVLPDEGDPSFPEKRCISKGGLLSIKSGRIIIK